MYEHRNGTYKNSFTNKYALHKLVYYEVFLRIEDAIAREKQIKGGSRKDKDALIQSMNPTWKDLWEDIQDL